MGSYRNYSHNILKLRIYVDRNGVKLVNSCLRFFSPQQKQERELWVGHEFLSYIGLSAEKENLKPWVDEPPDLIFNGARFEVKEIPDEGRQRGREFKEALKKAIKAESGQDLLEDYTPQRIQLPEAITVITQKAIFWSRKYAPEVTRSLDLLFYFNWQDCSIIGDKISIQHNKDIEPFNSWRSIAVVSNDSAFVLFANDNAPLFLKNAIGHLFRKSI